MMKAWQKGFLGGLAVGSLGIAPLAFWLAEFSATFRCPGCHTPITVRKGSKQMGLQIGAESRREANRTDESSSESTLSIATAPTV